MTAIARRRIASPRLSEIDFQRQLVGYAKGQPTGLATMLGWQHVHFRPAMTKHGYRTPGTGELAAWPDLVLVRNRLEPETLRVDARLIFAELKADDGELSDGQREVLRTLSGLAWPRCSCPPAAGLEDWQLFAGPIVAGDRHHATCQLLPPYAGERPRIQVQVWRPRDFDAIAEVLR